MASFPFPRFSAFSPAAQNTDRFSEFNRKRVNIQGPGNLLDGRRQKAIQV